MYKKIDDFTVMRLEDQAVIPFDDANVDYRDYLAWIEQGNVPVLSGGVPVVVPMSVTPLQARRALLGAGLLDAVQAAANAADDETRLAWEYSSSVERASPFVAKLALAIGLSDEQVDDLFREAAVLV